MPTTRVLRVDARPLGRDSDALARLISDAEAQVVCVHNAPHLARWRSKCAAIARRSGLIVVGGGGRSTGANLLLCALGVDALPVRELTFSGGSGLVPPGAAVAALRVRGEPLVFAGATLRGNSALRRQQVTELLAAAGEAVPGGAPVVLAVRTSDRLGSAAWQALSQGRAAAADGLWVDDQLTVTGAGGAAAPVPYATVDLDL